MPVSSPYTANQQIESRFSSAIFSPDGDLSKAVWKRAHWISFNYHVYTGEPYIGAETEVASFWTANYIYFAFQCKYSVLNVYEHEDPLKERWELWNRDVVEVFINPKPQDINHYYEFEVAPNNQWIDLEIDKTKDPFYDPEWTSGFDHATRVDSSGHRWTCEMRIPLLSMRVPEIQVGGVEWRLNFFRADGIGDNSQRRLMAWSVIPGGDTFHTPTRFGLIRFVR